MRLLRWLYLLPVLALAGCGRAGASAASLPLDQLNQAWAQQLALYTADADPASGWASATDCDSAIWSGEARFSGVSSVQIQDVLQPDGRPTRLPNEDCPSSGWTTSTDMQLGAIIGLLGAQNETNLALLQSYTEDNGGIVGSPSSQAVDLAYVEMKPGTRSLLALANQKLGGTGAQPWLDLPILYSPPFADYTLHLALLSLLGERVVGSEGALDRELEQALCYANPADALAQAVCGNLETASALILSTSYQDPSYVRGAPAYSPVHHLMVLSLILNGTPN